MKVPYFRATVATMIAVAGSPVVSGNTYSVGAATIFVPASAGRFVKAVIGVAAPAEGE